MKNNNISIAYDKQNVQFVAYNVKTGIFVVGVSVDVVVEKYRQRYYETENKKLKTYANEVEG